MPFKDYTVDTQRSFGTLQDSLNTPAFKPFPQATRDPALIAQHIRDWRETDGEALIPLAG